MKKKDIIQLVKDTINEIGADAYGDATLTSQGQSKSRFTKTGRPPGVMEDENLDEFKNIPAGVKMKLDDKKKKTRLIYLILNLINKF